MINYKCIPTFWPNLQSNLINPTLYYKYMLTLIHSLIIFFELLHTHISHKHCMDHWHCTHVYCCTNIQELHWTNISSHCKSFKVYKTWFDSRFTWINVHYITQLFSRMKWFVSKAKAQNTPLHLQQYEEDGHGLNMELANEHLLSSKL